MTAQQEKLAAEQLQNAKDQFAKFAPTIADLGSFFSEFSLQDVQEGRETPRALEAIQRDIVGTALGGIQRLQQQIGQAGTNVSQASLALPQLQQASSRLLTSAGEQTRRSDLEDRLRFSQLGSTGQLQVAEAARGQLSSLSSLADVAAASGRREALSAGQSAQGIGEFASLLLGRQGRV